MSGKTNKGPIIDSGRCRCCGSLKKCRILNAEYDHLGQLEVYSDLLMDCFGLLLCNMDGEKRERGVCATCVLRLRDAANFKRQVLGCEELLLQKVHSNKDKEAVKVEVKLESIDETEVFIIPDPVATSTDQLKYEKKIKNNEVKTKSKLVNNDAILKMKRYEVLLKKKLAASAPEKRRAVGVQKRQLFKKNDNKLHIKMTKKMTSEREENMVHHNRITIVKYSYVCPFSNRTSNYYCFYCKTIFTDPTELREHTFKHNPKFFYKSIERKRIPKLDITRIDCRLCTEKINDLETLKKHLTTHDKVIYPVTREFLTFKLSIDNLKCLECGLEHLFIDKLLDHMKEHFGKFVCAVCGARYIDERGFMWHSKKHDRTNSHFPCDVCGKNLTSFWGLNLHKAAVHEKKPFVDCYKCEASFLSYPQRQRHLMSVHGEVRKFTCTDCDEVFDVRKALLEHMRGHGKIY